MSINALSQGREEPLSMVAQNESIPPDDRDMSMQTYGDNQGKKEFMICNEMIPQELLFALTQSQSITGDHKDNTLAPIKTIKTPEKLKLALRKGPPANVWHHKGRRSLYKHLTDHPRSLGRGMGTSDISFLYDVSTEQKPKPPSPNKLDKSANRLEAAQSPKVSAKLAVSDSVIPEEYHLVKSKAVLGLEYVDEDMTTKLADKEQLLRIFPSLQPTKRFEVLQLLHTLDCMLEQSGINDTNVEIKGPTQIHNLLELINKEQNIYDLVFNEIIRQVSVECIERGQLLSKLRLKYADLLNRVPRQIKSLHAEVMAQRSLDRRLTEELLRFKSSISFLTTELQNVREHDRKVTEDATNAETDLAKALEESQTNANLVDEYHNLYELQRQRLEANVASLTAERDLWSNAAYNLSLKIASANSLNSAKRLHVGEKAWSKLSNHFTVMLTDHDSEDLSKIQMHGKEWRDIIFHFNQSLESADKHTKDTLIAVREDIEKWIKIFDDTVISVTSDIRSVIIPPKEFVQRVCNTMKSWEEKLGEDSERFAGGLLLANQEKLNQMRKENEAWTEVAWNVYRRHKTEKGENFPLAEDMMNLNERLHKLEKQLNTRITGENGVARGAINLQNSVDAWVNKLTLLQHGSASLTESEWLQLYDKLIEYVAIINETLGCVGSQQRDDERLRGALHEHIDIEKTMQSVQNWIKDTLNQIEAEDGKLMSQVTSLHNKMVEWMIQMLLHLAPDHESYQSEFPTETSLVARCSVEELRKKAEDITDHISIFTNYFSQCCSGIVLATMQEKKDNNDDDADHEYNDFLRVKREAKEWIHVCEILSSSIIGEEVKLFNDTILSKLRSLDEAKSVESVLSSQDISEEPSKSTSEVTMVLKPMVKPEDVVNIKVETAESIESKEISKSTSEVTRILKPEGVATTEADTAESLESKKPGTDDKFESKDKDEKEKASVAAKATDGLSSSKLPTSMEVIGADENVQTAPLIPSSMSIGASITSDLSPPSSTLTQSAYDAIVKMNHVQDELLAAEQRAQRAEEKVIDLEEELNFAQEKIRGLEKQIATLNAEKNEESSDLNEESKASDTSLLEKVKTSDDSQEASEETKRRSSSSKSSTKVKTTKASKKK